MLQLVQENAESDENLCKIIKVVYKKAQMEPKYGEVYSKLVKTLINKEKECKNTTEIKKLKLREELLNLCKKSFELFSTPP